MLMFPGQEMASKSGMFGYSPVPHELLILGTSCLPLPCLFHSLQGFRKVLEFWVLKGALSSVCQSRSYSFPYVQDFVKKIHYSFVTKARKPECRAPGEEESPARHPSPLGFLSSLLSEAHFLLIVNITNAKYPSPFTFST